MFSEVVHAESNSESPQLKTRLSECSLIRKDSKRLACFDDLFTSSAEGNSLGKGTSKSLPENLGGGKFDKTKKEIVSNFGKLSKCKKSHDGRWLFYFENGQVWKQSNIDRVSRRYKGCDYEVEIQKDGFGYKMFIEKLSRKVRVKRLK